MRAPASGERQRPQMPRAAILACKILLCYTLSHVTYCNMRFEVLD